MSSASGLLTTVLVAAGVVAGIALVVAALRRARTRGALGTRQGRCEACGGRGPIMTVSFHQNTGMLFMRQHRGFSASACRRCSTHLCAKMTLHTLAFGWWGMISLVLAPLFIVNNLAYGLAAMTLPNATDVAVSGLEVYREYALNLLATKDEAIVVEVLTRVSGAPVTDVEAWLRRIRPAA